MPGGLVGNGDFGVRGTVGKTNDAGQRRERGSVVLTGLTQRGVEVGGRLSPCRRTRRLSRAGRTRYSRCNCFDFRRPRAATSRRSSGAGVDLDANAVPSAAPVSCVVIRVWLSRGSICSTSSCVHRHGVGGQAERFAACGQRDLGEGRGGQDGLAMHFVVGEPWAHLGSDVGLPDVVAPGRQFRVRRRAADGCWSSSSTPDRSATQNVECCHGACGTSTRRSLGASAPQPPTAASWVWKNSVWSSSRFIADAHPHSPRRRHRFQGVGDGVGEQRVRADLDEGAVVRAGGGDGLAEAHRVAQVGRPVVGVEARYARGGRWW